MNDMKKMAFDRLLQLERIIGRQQMHNLGGPGGFRNPRRGQGRVLAVLKMKPEISQKELTYLLDMTKQSLAELLVKLEKNGYIVREPSEEDRRAVNIKLTEKGASASGELEEEPQGMLQLLDCLSEEELTNLNLYLEKIITKFQEQFINSEVFQKRQKAFEEMRREHGANMRRKSGDAPFDRDHPHPHETPFEHGRFGGRKPYPFGFGMPNQEDDDSE